MINYCDTEFQRQHRPYGTQDGHGGMAYEHQQEMRQIAQEQICALVPKMVEEICVNTWNEALQRIIGAIRYDVTACVKVALKNGREIFNDKRTEKIISEAIVKELRKELDKLGRMKIKF